MTTSEDIRIFLHGIILFKSDEEQKIIEEEMRIKAKQEALLQSKEKKTRHKVSIRKTAPLLIKSKQPVNSDLGFARAMGTKKIPTKFSEVKQVQL